ncbi:hypothetical protein IF1G_05567 [Cordyceps javanica]|uniref:Secreted protein n=1 Tax=Cordyceps javanica TaxID=43265 RepID=A0A545V1Y9_9HYPO|nr:hypothetical protein IF1G_05567 [Cordyceps javanica]
MAGLPLLEWTVGLFFCCQLQSPGNSTNMSSHEAASAETEMTRQSLPLVTFKYWYGLLATHIQHLCVFPTPPMPRFNRAPRRTPQLHTNITYMGKTACMALLPLVKMIMCSIADPVTLWVSCGPCLLTRKRGRKQCSMLGAGMRFVPQLHRNFSFSFFLIDLSRLALRITPLDMLCKGHIEAGFCSRILPNADNGSVSKQSARLVMAATHPLAGYTACSS